MFIFIGMAFGGGVSLWWFVLAIGLIVAAFPILWQFLGEYQQNRFLILVDDTIDPMGINERYHSMMNLRSLTGGGLTDLGKAYVQNAQALGMLVDVSHCSDEGFWDIVKITGAPIIASHSNSRAVWNHSRNVTDDMFRAIRETGGVVGINEYAAFLGENATLDTVCDHILHFMELDPEGKHIALGGDLDGCSQLPQSFTGVDSYQSLAERLLERGLTEQNVMDIYWNNALGVMSTALRNNKID